MPFSSQDYLNGNEDNHLCRYSHAFSGEGGSLALFERERFIFLEQVDKLPAKVVS